MCLDRTIESKNDITNFYLNFMFIYSCKMETEEDKHLSVGA